MDSKNVLVVESDPQARERLTNVVEQLGLSIHWADSLDTVTETMRSKEILLVITDLSLAGETGFEVCRRVHALHPDVPVIMVGKDATMTDGVRAIRAGVYDYLTRPLDENAVTIAVERAIQHRRLHSELERLQRSGGHTRGKLVGKSEPMLRVYDLIERVKDSDASVLLVGESGTGKELVARALHEEGERSKYPFVAINCAAVPANLLESELFGHTKGAFTDARSARLGLLQQADRGTILLDEIGEMPVEMQVKLLRVLQERRVRPVGGTSETPFFARVIAATNRDLDSAVEEGAFREDLYYRLNVVQISVPPLRVRGNDILVLATHFLDDASSRLGKEVRGLSAEAAQKLLDYEWPGNVRQLQNCMERAVTLTHYDQIVVDDLPEKIKSFDVGRRTPDPDPEHILPLTAVEERYIKKVLELCDGNKSQAARALGLDRRTLYRRLERIS